MPTPHRSAPKAPPVPGLRERKKARTKATIQREALRLFSRDGYAETSVEQIAAAAEVSPSTFFRYFPSKDDLVLTDFIDTRVIALFLAAPRELGPLAALRVAIDALTRELTKEELELEMLRNRLIQSVPELRRGMIAEMVRPMRLFADALAVRLGRTKGDPDLLLFSGAAIGAMLVTDAAEHLGAGPVEGSARELLGTLVERLERLERLLSLPEPGTT